MARHAMPGLAVGLVQGRPGDIRCYGLADIASGRPVGPDTIFRIASVSKTITSLAIMQLRDAGKLDLDDPVGRHLRQFRVVAAPGGPDITIRHLLTRSRAWAPCGRSATPFNCGRWPRSAPPRAARTGRPGSTTAVVCGRPVRPGRSGRTPTTPSTCSAAWSPTSAASASTTTCAGPRAVRHVRHHVPARRRRHRSLRDRLPAHPPWHRAGDRPRRRPAPPAARRAGPTCAGTPTGFLAAAATRTASSGGHRCGNVRTTARASGRLGEGLPFVLSTFEGHPVASHGGAWNGFATLFVLARTTTSPWVAWSNRWQPSGAAGGEEVGHRRVALAARQAGRRPGADRRGLGRMARHRGSLHPPPGLNSNVVQPPAAGNESSRCAPSAAPSRCARCFRAALQRA